MDIFKISINNNDDEFIYDMPLEEMKMSLTDKIINISLKKIKHSMELGSAFSNNKIFKGLLNQIYVMTYKKWKIYLNYIDCGCKYKNCLCKLILDLNSVKVIKLGVIACAKNYERNLILKNTEILTDDDDGGKYEKNGYEYLFYDPNDSEEVSNSVIIDSSYKVYMTILNKLILHKEFLEYSYRPDNFIKFKLEEIA
jgi:hypothetical protein